MPLPGTTREQLIAEQQQRYKRQTESAEGVPMGQQRPQPTTPATGAPQGGPSKGKAQGVYRQSPWGTRITTPRGSNGSGFPYYDLDEYDIPVPSEDMTDQEFEQYFRDLGEVSPPVSREDLKGPWKAAIEYAWKRLPQKQAIPMRHARLLFENYDTE